MSEIENIANTEFGKLLQHIDSRELDTVKWLTDGQDMLEELLGIVMAAANDMISTLGMADLSWEMS